MPNFRKEMFPEYKATRDSRTKVHVHMIKVAGGFSVNVTDALDRESLFHGHISSPSHSQDHADVLYNGTLALCAKKQLRPMKAFFTADGATTVKRLA